MTIKVIGKPTTVIAQWLVKYFEGEADQESFIKHFGSNCRTSKGNQIAKNNVYVRLRRDEIRGNIIRTE